MNCSKYFVECLCSSSFNVEQMSLYSTVQVATTVYHRYFNLQRVKFQYADLNLHFHFQWVFPSGNQLPEKDTSFGNNS